MNTSIRQGIHEYDSQAIRSVDMNVNNVLALIFVYDVLALINYAIGNFEQSLKEIQRLSHEFNCDVSDNEGRVLLAAKIEEMNLNMIGVFR